MNDIEKHNYDLIDKTQEDLQKYLFIIPSATLGVSFISINQIIPLQTSEYLDLLYLSWIFLSLSISCNLIFSYCAIILFRKNLRAYKLIDRYDEKAYIIQQKKGRKIVRWFDVIIIILFLVGIILFFIFVTKNLSMANEKKQSEQISTVDDFKNLKNIRNDNIVHASNIEPNSQPDKDKFTRQDNIVIPTPPPVSVPPIPNTNEPTKK